MHPRFSSFRRALSARLKVPMPPAPRIGRCLRAPFADLLASTRLEAVPVRDTPRIQNRTTDHGQVRFLLPCALRLQAQRRDAGRVAGLVRRAGLGPGGRRQRGDRLRLARRGRRQRLPDGRLLGGVRRGHGLRAGAGQGLPGAAGRRRGRGRPRDGSRRVVSDAMTATTAPPEGSFLATGRGKVTLALLCLVTSLDVMDGSIVNVAMPTIRSHLGFSVQNLQWVVSGYLITYGGFLLLGGRAADLLGRRRLLVAGTALFAVASLACGLADSQGLLVGARLAQGFGAAMMTPAALSILTTTFQDSDRHKALGVWAGISGMATMVGLFFGGLLTQEFGWRWVFFISLPPAALVLFGTVRIIKADHGRSGPGGFDAVGAVLVTASMLLLIFTLVKTPDVGWGTGRTIGGLAGSAVLMAAFLVNEQRRAHPLVPLSIFRIKGLAAADATQVIAWAGFYSMFFFVTLYMQDVLGFSQLRSGLSYVPVSVGIGVGSTVATKMFVRTGTRPIIVSGALLAAGGIGWLSRIPVDGTYLGNLLAPLVVMGTGLGLLYAGVQTAANAGVPQDQAGLAAALITASFQLGSALGLAVFSGIATSRTSHLLAAHTPHPEALTAGFQRALLVSALCLVAAGAIALRASNTRGEPAATPQTQRNLEPSYDPA